MPTELDLVIRGKDVRPETVDASDVVFIVGRLQSAIVAAALLTDGEPPLIALVGVRSGSDELRLAYNSVALRAATVIAIALSTGDISQLPPLARKPLLDVSTRVAARGWELAQSANAAAGITGWTISAEHPVRDISVVEVRGGTSILATCTRVGNVERPTAQLLLKTGRALYAPVTETIARKLGAMLYEEIVVEGDAVWNSETWDIESFTIRDASRAPGSDAAAAFARLREAVGGALDDIDVEAFVADARGREGG